MQSARAWPALRVEDWGQTCDTVHMWAQIIGKIRLSQTPLINHWWNATLYVTARGLTTSSIPYGDRLFDIEFDFIDHDLRIRTSDGDGRSVALKPQSVAEFYRRTFAALGELQIEPKIDPRPNEVDPAIPFADDEEHKSYDAAAVTTFWQQLQSAHRVFTAFRSHFVGKASPVHFFWGAFDLACTRFSGRPAPEHPGGAPNCPDSVMVEGYSRELSSCGFWPGGGEEGAFYAYAYPEPEGFSAYQVGPEAAYYSDQHREFLLPYEAVRTDGEPDRALMQFLQDTYAACADLAHWDRALLEDDPHRWVEGPSAAG
ncbi:DUF5996 family protein [Mycolicibacterium litorale]|uniref:DUF5996 family protein n=1 Tax=Mycolicibacterium litorale TaxID=758802 RepID=UPI003CE8C7D9